MKKGVFITHPGCIGKVYSHPWKNKNFNSYERQLEAGDGLLNLLCRFAPDPARTVEKVVVRATSLGIFDLFVNGIRAGSPAEDGSGMVCDELKPLWTDYRCRVFEFEYDVTDICRDDNTVVAEVSPGWWTGRISFGFYGSKACAFAGEVEITYADGGTELIPTCVGGQWKAAICGPVLTADIWDGEYYDARIPEPSIYPEAHEWSEPIAFDGFTGKIVSLEGPAVRSLPHLVHRPMSAVIHEGVIDDGSPLGAINVISRKFGDGCEVARLMPGQAMILDMGDNMVGRPAIFLSAEKGTKVEIFCAEMLNDSGDDKRGNDGPRGSMYIKNYRSALARTVYIASGSENEYYFPTHAFYGFRYLEVRVDKETAIYAVMGDVLGSVLEDTGSFACDNPEVNRLYANIVRGMRGNYLCIPTDCPQRDERLGWTGDTQIFSGAAAYMADIGPFMHKWLGDARDSQFEGEGAYCDVIPRVFGDHGHNANAAWGDAGIIVPWKLYTMYGDRAIVEEHYESMETYMKHLEQYGLEGPNTAYGDWLNYDVTDKRYIAVCYYAYDSLLMEKFSRILEKTDRAEYYAELRKKIIAHWREKYIVDGKLSVNTQTAYLLALAFGLVEGDERFAFIAALKQKIADNDYTLSTGFVGTGILNQTLSDVGLDKEAYSLLLQTRDPSWLYSVRQGATTVWERWNSYTYERGFGDVGMNSFNHYAYGAVAEWFYAGMCGIRPDPNEPGFTHFYLCPTPDLRTDAELPAGQRRIGFARAVYNSHAGAIASGWERILDNTCTEYSFVIPDDTVATLSLVAGDKINVNGVDMTADDLYGSVVSGRIVFSLDPGTYVIRITDKKD